MFKYYKYILISINRFFLVENNNEGYKKPDSIESHKQDLKSFLKNIAEKSENSSLDEIIDNSDYKDLTEKKNKEIVIENILKLGGEKYRFLKTGKALPLDILNRMIDEIKELNEKTKIAVDGARAYSNSGKIDIVKPITNEEKVSEESQGEVITKYKTTFLGIDVDFISPEVNEYMNNPEIIRLLKLLDFKELNALVGEINNLYGQDHEFKDYDFFYGLKDILAKKGYKADWIMLGSDAAVIVQSLRNYAKMQSEIIPNLDDEGIVKMLIDSDKDGKLSKETISNYGTEFDVFLSTLRNRLNKDNAQNLIKNIGLGSIGDLKKDMSKNLYSTRENFQRMLRTLKESGFNLIDLFNKDFIRNKVSNQIKEVKEGREKVPEELKTGLLNWIVSKQSIPTLIPSSREELNDSGKNLYDKMLDNFSPSFLGIDFGGGSGPGISASFPIPKLPETAKGYEDFFNLITPDSFSISTGFDGNLPSFSINKNILPSFLNKYGAYVTFTLVNGFMPVLSGGKNFEMKDMGDITELFQEKAKREGIDSNVHFSLNPLGRTIDVGVNFSKVDENTQVGIERMTNKTGELLKDIGVKILNGDKYISGDNNLYSNIKRTFDSITEGLSTEDKTMYMNNVFLKGYLKAYKDFLYKSAEGFELTSIGVGFTNRFGDNITEKMKDLIYENAGDVLSKKTGGKIPSKGFLKQSVKDLGAYGKVDQMMNKEKKEINEQTYGITDLILEGYLNPIPYITLGAEYKTTEYKKENNSEKQRENKEQKNLENIGNNGDVIIENINGKEVLSINNELIQNISSKSSTVELNKVGDRIYLGGVDLSKLEFYNKVDDGKSDIYILIDGGDKNKKGNFKKATPIELKNSIKYDKENPKINISSSSTGYKQENKTISLGATAKGPELKKIAIELALKEVRKAVSKEIDNYLPKLVNNGITLDILGRTVDSYINNRDNIIHIRGVLGGREKIEVKEDLNNLKNLFISIGKIATIEDLSKINYKGLINDFNIPISDGKIQTAENVINIIEKVIKHGVNFNEIGDRIVSEIDNNKPKNILKNKIKSI